ncbi:right-handed parallel beta-helix repeat-containing protein [Streptomyces sp. NPDC087428]|uniref:right-handed parallel beta-helix repeat-containing protein n=1 Tax=Streptomyces sp. NPDC087428 TaxID=3365788 RepID=UPI003805BA84
MALYTYGGNGAAVLVDTAGNVVPDYPVNVRVAGTGQPVTALFEVDGITPIGALRSNAAGQDSPGAIRTFKVDGVVGIEYEYNDAAGPVRWFEQGREVGAAALAGLADKLDRSGGTITGDLDIEGVLTVNGQPGGAALWGAKIYNVRDLGAQGDGIADDAPAVQGALDKARDLGGGTVLIPAGTYRLASLPLRIYRNTTLRSLPGARLVRAAATTMLVNGDAGQDFGIYTGHGGITVEGGTWDMQGTIVTASSMCMSFGHADGITVRGITVLDLPGYHGVEFNAIKNGRVLDSVFRGYINPGNRDFSEAIQIDLAKSHDEFGPFGPYDDTPCTDILISGCTVGPSGTAGTTSWPRGIGSHSASPDKQHRDIRIIGCRFEGCLQYAIGAYVWSGIVISNVQMRDCAGGIRIRPLTSATASQRTPAGGTTPTIAGSQPVTGYSISNVTMIGGGTFDAAIRAEGEETGYVGTLAIDNIVCKDIAGTAVRLLYVEDYSVQQVVALNCGATAISQFGTRRGRVQGCTINGAAGAGIGLDSRATPSATATDVTISDCMITATTTNGVSVWDGADVTITDCDLHDLTGAGVQISANTARPVIRGVRTRNCSTANISVSSTVTGTVRSDNTGDAPTAQSVATAANTTAETVIASWSIPAGDAADRCAYRYTAQGVASTTGTPTLTIRIRLGGVAGAIIAAFTAVPTSAGIAGRGWRVDGSLLPVTLGASGTWAGGATLTHHLASTTGAVQHELTDAPVTRDSTSSQALVVTAQWSAATAANSAQCQVGQLVRVA